MSTRDIDIMIVDDEADIRNGLARLVGGTGARVRAAASGEEALALMAEYESELLLSDIKMRGMSGVELLRALRRHHPRTGVLLMTGFGTIELAVQCLQLGALHFLTKPFDNEEILETIERLAARVSADRAAMSPGTDEKGFVASDRAMRPVIEAIDHVAGTRIPVLIQGESGTGKEVVARAIHEAGGAERPLVAVNCAAIPDALLESELFGHRKGAFTGADRNHDGVFQRADGGTLFLDEVPSMSPAFQAKLLRVLQDKTFTPLGAERQHTADFRLIAATNRDLRKMVTAGNSVKIYSTASMCSPSPSRRCVNGWAISKRLHGCFSGAQHAACCATGRRHLLSPARHLMNCAPMIGQVMCGNWRMPYSAR